MTRERPILFSGDMVRAIIDGRKTMTRRVVKWRNVAHGLNQHFSGLHANVTTDGRWILESPSRISMEPRCDPTSCPYGSIGDHLYVRENGWERPSRTPRMMREGADTWERFYYDADGLSDGDRDDFKAWGFKRRPSIHMPRWASRITLEIMDVRVERVQSINDEDALSEGIYPTKTGLYPGSPRATFRELWDSLNAKRNGCAWNQNPFVWCISFRRLP